MARTAAGSDQSMVGGDGFAVHFNGFGIDKAGKTFNHIHGYFCPARCRMKYGYAVNIRGAAGNPACSSRTD